MLGAILVFLSVCIDASHGHERQGPGKTYHGSAMELITRINFPSGNHPEPGVDLFDVDIRWPRPSLASGSRNRRAAIRSKTRLWPNGEIPYILDDNIVKRANYVRVIQKGMREWEKWTCIKFKKRTTEYAYVRFYYGRGCNAYIGYHFGQTNDVSLGKGCDRFKVVLHELGHVIGFYHEHSRPDRDKYVKILWNNIHPRYKFSFRKIKPWLISSRGVKYDYHSIMHYGMLSFTKNGRITMQPRDPSIKFYGGDALSELDKKQANLMYGCQRRKPIFPQDFSWEEQDIKSKRCLRVYEPRDPYWRDKYLCYKGFLKNLGLLWSHRGRIAGMDCIRVRIPFRPWWTTWNDNYLCAPKNCMYKFYWSAFGRRRGMGCIKVRDDTRMKFHYLCAKVDRQFDSATPKSSWSRWSSWSLCSKDCGVGVRKRRRKCYYSPFRYGEPSCKGKTSEHQFCNLQACTDWPIWKSDFAFGVFKSAPPGMTCLKIYEGLEYYKWINYNFCWNNRGRQWSPRWSDSGRIRDMRCTQIYDAGYSRWWRDNFLCFPIDTPYRFQWSVRGPIVGSQCMQWNQTLKGWEHNYLCATPEHECPTFWTQYEDQGDTHCYFKAPERRIWSQAQLHCEQLKGNLLSVISRHEANFVWNNVVQHSNVWIGLNDRRQENNWQWSDGRSLGYTNWDRGDPNDGGDRHNEDCAMIKYTNSKWNDFPCDTKFQYICKITLNNSPYVLYRSVPK